MADPKAFEKLIADAEKANNLPPRLLYSLIEAESAFDPNAHSDAGALGLGQFMPETGKRYGLVTKEDFFNPEKSISAAGRHLKDLLVEHKGSLNKALASYNAGTGNVQKYAKKGNINGVPPFAETTNYVAKIRNIYNAYKEKPYSFESETSPKAPVKFETVLNDEKAKQNELNPQQSPQENPVIFEVPGIGNVEFSSEQEANDWISKNQDKFTPQNKSEPVGAMDRAKLGFGNTAGSLEYLKSKGMTPEYQNGELMTGQGTGKAPVDPNGMMTFLESIFPSQMGVYAGAKQMLDPTTEAKSRVERWLRDAKDLPTDLAEVPSDILNMAASTLGASGGAYLGGAAGGLTGPLAPAAVPLLAGAGSVAGAATGGLGSEKLKQKIGEELGTYKTDGEFFTPESLASARNSAIAQTIPALLQYGKMAKQGAGDVLRYYKVPEKLYGQGTGLLDDFAKDPEMASYLLKNGMTGARENLKGMADRAGNWKLAELDNELSNAKDISFDSFKKTVGKYIEQPNGIDEKAFNKTLERAFESFKKARFNEVSKQIPNPMAGQPVDLPDETYLKKIYEKQWPKDKINLEMAPYKTEKLVPNKRPSFEEFKASVVDPLQQADKETGSIGSLVVAKAANNPTETATENALLKAYEEMYPAEKTISKVFPAPKGQMKAPSFDEWKKTFVDEYIRKNSPKEFITETDLKIPALALNEEKRALQAAAESKFGDNSYDTSLKGIKKAFSQAAREEVEKSVDDPTKIASINKEIYYNKALAKALAEKTQTEAEKPMFTGMDAVVGAGAGGVPLVAKKVIENVPKNTYAMTKTASFLYKLLNNPGSKWAEERGFQAMPKTQTFLQALFNQNIPPSEQGQ